jgi:hypothetical protein
MLRWVPGIKNNKDNIVDQLKSHFLIGFAAQVIRSWRAFHQKQEWLMAMIVLSGSAAIGIPVTTD